MASQEMEDDRHAPGGCPSIQAFRHDSKGLPVSETSPTEGTKPFSSMWMMANEPNPYPRSGTEYGDLLRDLSRSSFHAPSALARFLDGSGVAEWPVVAAINRADLAGMPGVGDKCRLWAGSQRRTRQTGTWAEDRTPCRWKLSGMSRRGLLLTLIPTRAGQKSCFSNNKVWQHPRPKGDMAPQVRCVRSTDYLSGRHSTRTAITN